MCGLQRQDDRPFKDSFNQFYASLGHIKHQPTALKSHPLPYGNYLQRPAFNRILLVGDACGLADPLLGEGIYYAHLSAQLAAQAICTSISVDIDTRYSQLLKHRIVRELRWIHFYRNFLFWGGRKRKYRGLKYCLHLLPKRLEAVVHGKRSFAHFLTP